MQTSRPIHIIYEPYLFFQRQHMLCHWPYFRDGETFNITCHFFLRNIWCGCVFTYGLVPISKNIAEYIFFFRLVSFYLQNSLCTAIKSVYYFIVTFHWFIIPALFNFLAEIVVYWRWMDTSILNDNITAVIRCHAKCHYPQDRSLWRSVAYVQP